MTRITTTQQQLEKFGLSKNQASIYLLLLQHEKLRVQEIANLSLIPRSSVYETLKGLFEFGLAEEIIEENYKIIKPYPITALRHVLNEKIENLKTISSQLDGMETMLSVKQSLSFSSATVRYYKTKTGARQLFWNTLKATSNVYVYSEFGRSKYVGKKFYQDFVSESSNRKIKEKVLINPTQRALGLIARDTGSSLARTKIDTIRTMKQDDLIIRGETFIYDDIYAQVYLDRGEINGFEIESPYFVETQVSIFQTLWNMAKPLIRQIPK